MKKRSLSLITTGLLSFSLLLTACGGQEGEEAHNHDNTEETTNDEPSENDVTADLAFGDLLMEFESNIAWKAVSENWKTRRTAWVEDCMSSSSTSELSSLLRELEANVLWTAVDEKWANTRNVWVENCAAASNNAELAEYLKQFESYVKWDAVGENWKTRRDSWIEDVSSVE